MKHFIFILFYLAFAFRGFSQAPSNDNCAGAIPIAIGNPPACGTGLQQSPTATVTGNITNATPGNPYIYQPGCSGPGGPNQAFPANDVWYSFVATGYQAVININSSFANPNIAFYSGNCAALGGGIGGCAVGTGGNVSLTVNQMVPGTTYYLQVSGNTGQTGTFTMTIQNNVDCQNCLQTTTVTVSPPPVNGAYAPNTTVNVCLHIGSYKTINTNWLHGVQLSFGSGWDAASLVPNVPVGISGAGTWSYYPTGIGLQNAVNWGPGWYYDFLPNDGNPKNNFGDSNSGGAPGFLDVSTAAQWNFCVSLKTSSVCSPGSNLSVTFNTSGDGESGSWSNLGCANDNAVNFNAVGACCPPNMSSLPVACFGTNTGSATAVPVGTVGPYSYNWAGPSAFSFSASNIAGAHTLTNVAAGIYTVTIIDNNLCAVSSTVQVTQPSSITATSSFTNAGCSSNGIGSVSVTGGTPPYSYTWSPSGGNAASASLPIGNYTVTVQDSKLCTQTATVAIGLTGTVSPAFTTPTYTQCLNGNSFTFNAGDPSGSHTYSFIPVLGAPASGNTANYGPLSFTSPGTYTVVHTITVGVCSAITSSIVVLNPMPIAIAGNNGPVCVGNAVNLTSGGGTTYSWSGPNSFTSLLQNPSIASSSTIDAGVYTVSVTSLGCTSTATTNVIVSTPTTSAANTGPYCAGWSIQLMAPAASSYTWTGPNAFSNNTQNPTIPNSTSAMAGTYTLLVNIGTCTATAVTNVSILPLPSPTIISNAPICFGNNLILNGAGGNTYQWDGPSFFTTSNQSATITSVNISHSGIYTLTVTDANSCSNFTTMNIQVNPQPTVSAFGSTVCAGNNANLSANGGQTYSWTGPNGYVSNLQNPVFVNASPANVGQYTVVVTDANTCTNTATADIDVSPIPSPSITGNGTVCINSSISFTADGGSSYAWSGPANFTSATPVASISSVNQSVSGVYIVTVTSVNGCKATTSVEALVLALPTVSVSSDKKSGCATLCINFSCTSTSSVQNFNWHLDNGFSFFGTGPTASGCYTAAGIHTITARVTDVFGCQNSGTYTIEVYPKPIAQFTYTPAKPIANVSGDVNFKDQSYNAKIVQWNWYFMSTNDYQSSQQNPTFVYPETGDYLVALVVKSDKACYDTVYKRIVIGDDFSIYIPNAFTPNDSKLNDTFYPKGFGITEYQMEIFDRWGEKLFTSYDLHIGWDGTHNGKICKDDVYVYRIVITNVYGKQLEYVGHVTLLK